MLWLYLALGIVSAMPTVLAGFNELGAGRDLWAVSRIVTPIGWVLLLATAIAFSERLGAGAWKSFVRILLVALMFVGSALGQFLGNYSALGFSYGATNADVAFGFPMFFGVGALVALVLSLVIATGVVAYARLFTQPVSRTSTPQE